MTLRGPQANPLRGVLYIVIALAGIALQVWGSFNASWAFWIGTSIVVAATVMLFALVFVLRRDPDR